MPSRKLTEDADADAVAFFTRIHAQFPDRDDPEKLREALGYETSSIDELVSEARSRDDLDVICHICHHQLELDFDDEWHFCLMTALPICDGCARDLETAVTTGAILALPQDSLTQPLPGFDPTPDNSEAATQAATLRYRFANADTWLPPVIAKALDDAEAE